MKILEDALVFKLFGFGEFHSHCVDFFRTFNSKTSYETIA